VSEEGFADGFCNEWTNRVADLAGLGFVTACKPVFSGKCLQARGFADADCAVLIRMSEPSVRIADATGRKTGRGPIPGQPAVDVGVAVKLLVAIEPKRPGPPVSEIAFVSAEWLKSRVIPMTLSRRAGESWNIP
jgi:hypothetical protein